jgi:hypothetical protein
MQAGRYNGCHGECGRRNARPNRDSIHALPPTGELVSCCPQKYCGNPLVTSRVYLPEAFRKLATTPLVSSPSNIDMRFMYFSPTWLLTSKNRLNWPLRFDLLSAENLPIVIIISGNVIQGSKQRTQYARIEFKHY